MRSIIYDSLEFLFDAALLPHRHTPMRCLWCDDVGVPGPGISQRPTHFRASSTGMRDELAHGPLCHKYTHARAGVLMRFMWCDLCPKHLGINRVYAEHGGLACRIASNQRHRITGELCANRHPVCVIVNRTFRCRRDELSPGEAYSLGGYAIPVTRARLALVKLLNHKFIRELERDRRTGRPSRPRPPGAGLNYLCGVTIFASLLTVPSAAEQLNAHRGFAGGEEASVRDVISN